MARCLRPSRSRLEPLVRLSDVAGPEGRGTAMIKPSGISHIAMVTADLDRYRRLLRNHRRPRHRPRTRCGFRSWPPRHLLRGRNRPARVRGRRLRPDGSGDRFGDVRARSPRSPRVHRSRRGSAPSGRRPSRVGRSLLRRDPPAWPDAVGALRGPRRVRGRDQLLQPGPSSRRRSATTTRLSTPPGSSAPSVALRAVSDSMSRGFQGQSWLLARAAPSARARNFGHTTVGWTSGA